MNLKAELVRCYRSLMVHRLRTALSTLGVLFGVVAVVAMLSIGEGAKQETLEQIQQLGMNSIIVRQLELSEDQQAKAQEMRSHGLTVSDVEALARAIPTVELASPLKVIEAGVTGTAREMAPEILAVTSEFGTIKSLRCSEGRLLCATDITSQARVCVLGDEVARALGPRGHVGETLRIENAEFQIVGVVSSRRWAEAKNAALNSRNLNRSVLIPLGTEKGLPWKRGQQRKPPVLTEIVLQVESPAVLTETEQLVRRILGRTHNGVEDYQVVVPKELLHQAHKTQRTFNLVLGSIAAISLLVGGIGIMNIMLATVSERTREIGIRRAVGANQRHILTQFLLETLLLTLSGAILGVIFGLLFSMVISQVAGWKTIVQPWSVVLSLVMASGVGLASGVYPALKAARMSPITALRHD